MTEGSESARRRALLGGSQSGKDALRRIVIALSAVGVVTVVGTVGYLLLGFTLLEAVYQTITTVATVGFREVRPLSSAGLIFTIMLIVVGVGTVLYNLGVLVEAVTEGHLREYLERRRMDARIAAMNGHVVICGHGRVGRAAAEHLTGMGQPVVVLDSNPAKLAGLTIPNLVGDVLQDVTLEEAGLRKARALICALENDADTLYLTLSARAMCPDLVIISRARTLDSKGKLVLAGATRAVNPQLIGGRRMASFAMHGDVAEFLDGVMHDEELDYRIVQVRLQDDSPLIGSAVGSISVGGAQLLAIRLPHKGEFVVNPPAEHLLERGTTLIVLGDADQISSMRALGRDLTRA